MSTPEEVTAELFECLSGITYYLTIAGHKSLLKKAALAAVNVILAHDEIVWMDNEIKSETYYEDEETKSFWEKVKKLIEEE